MEDLPMIDINQYTRRRRFLGSMAALGLTSLALPGALAAHASPQDGMKAKTLDPSFDAWIKRIKGKYRQVFDSPFPDHGLPYAWSRAFIMTNMQVGVPESEITSVLILRHDSIPLAMTHDLWPKYNFSEVFGIKGEGDKPFTRNPFYQPEAPLPLPGMAAEELLRDNVLIGVCDLALTFYSKGVAEKMNMQPEDVKKDWVAGVIPGIQIVPSGVMAINRAQLAGCTYCFAG
jgi:hypothetical protein